MPLIGEANGLPERLRLSSLEELWAVPIGWDRDVQPLPPGGDPREELEQVALRALRRPPCLVSFSGGVDSSAVLAIAARVARREGLALPIPATNRFPGLAGAEESAWQERVVSHLGLQDWLRLEWHDELDIVGPVAARVLRRHGITVPFNGHFHYPLLERAAGGALLTGIGGDELFGGVTRGTAADILARRRRATIGDLPALSFGVAPRWMRSVVVARRRPICEYAWIGRRARRQLASAYATWESGDPLCFDRSRRDWWWPSRLLQCNLASKRALAEDFDVLIEHPFAAPQVIAACARAGGRAGLGSRRQALGRLIGDLLPHEVLGRSSKASFNGAFWNRHSAAFAADWDGAGLEGADVVPEALAAEWAGTDPDPHSFALLHRAWLATERSAVRRA